jgi:hypothetical protein
MRYVFLLAAALAGVASLVLAQGQAQTPTPQHVPQQVMQQCLAKCASCPSRPDGTIDPACAMKQQNCKIDCERQ